AAGAAFSTQDVEGGRRFVYRWPGVTVTVNEMPGKDVPGHLDGFRGYVRHIYRGEPDERGEQVLDRIGYTRLVVGVEIEPGREGEGGADGLLGTIAPGLRALMFLGWALYDHDAKLILAPDGSFDEEADVLGPVAEMIRDRVQVKPPEREPYRPTPSQEAR